MIIERFITAFMGGLSDLLNPPHLVILALCFVFFFFARDEKDLSIRSFRGFVSGYFLTAFLLRVGLFNLVLVMTWYSQFVAFLYVLIGFLMVGVGMACFLEWFRRYRSGTREVAVWKFAVSNAYAKYCSFWLGALIGILFAAAFNSWPANQLVMIMANEIYLPGLLWSTVFCVLLYEAVFVVFLVGLFLVIRFILGNNQYQIGSKYQTVVLAVLSALYMAFGVGFLVVFIQQII